MFVTVLVVLVAMVSPPIKGRTKTESTASAESITRIRSIPRLGEKSVTVQATLILRGDPAYVEDSGGGAIIKGMKYSGLRIGDQLLITGRAEETEDGLVIKERHSVMLWHGVPPPPLSVTADEASQGRFANLLIQVKGTLVRTEKRNGETWLILKRGQQEFVAHLDSGRGELSVPQVPEASVLRLRGVCSLSPSDTGFFGGFAVLLRSGQDVSVVTGPPWWSATHIIELGFLLALLIFAGYLAVVQMLKIRYKAIMAERAKLGHELHDTLAQSFAGLSFQIQAARKAVPSGNNTPRRHLDLALDMVRHSHAEAHRSIMMLRPQHLADGADLGSAIRQALEQSTLECEIDARFVMRGRVVQLRLDTTDTLYRVAQESIANALRHGNPSTLKVSLEYSPTSVRLAIHDNGMGFDPKSLRTKGFGVAGMRERVRAVRGSFSVESEPGKGTSVSVEIYLQRSVWSRFIVVLQQWRRVLQN